MRGANFFQKPEAALQRAQEFISVGKEQDALEALHDVIKVLLLDLTQLVHVGSTP